MSKTRVNRILASIISVTLMTTIWVPDFSYSAESQINQPIYNTASEWAKAEIKNAYDSGLLPKRLLPSDAAKPATREELCEIAVLLYEKITKNTLSAAANPFSDTSNNEILKAYKLGITSGTSASTFSPNDLTNREQVATMFGRTIRIMFPDDDYSVASAPVFIDQPQISSWAIDHVKFMSKQAIILGSNGKFMPRPITPEQKLSGYGTTKREEAIAIAVRIYSKYLGRNASAAGTVPVVKEQFAKTLIRTSLPVISESQKFSKIDFNKRVFRPVYKPNITLSAEDGFTTAGSPVYSSASFAATVSSRGDRIETFKISTPNDVLTKTDKIIWQVSLVPFDGKPVDMFSHAPGGLLLSGSVSNTAKEFSIDFAKVEQSDNALRKAKGINNFKISPIATTALISQNLPVHQSLTIDPNLTVNPNQFELNRNTLELTKQLLSGTAIPKKVLQRTYYVRAYPVDSYGRSIGDAGSGLPVVYGDPQSVRKDKSNKVYLPISLKLARESGPITYGKEFNNNFLSQVIGEISNTGLYKTYSILPVGYPSNTQEMRVQVSLLPYTGAADNWNDVAGLVYERSIFPYDPIYSGLKNSQTKGIEIDFSKFVPSDENLPEDKNIPYYIRTVCLIEGSQPGTMKALYSDSATITYGKFRPQSNNLFLENIKITPNLPKIDKIKYTPVQWEAENWQYHYKVFRQPTMKDVFGPMFGDSPYTPYQVGTKLDLSPRPEKEKSWWEEAWDAISGFFSDMASYFSKIVSWVSSAYADLKSGLIKFMVSAFPEGWRGPLEKALTALVDYGLASMGIPPTLPNFDELSEMGVDYLAAVAMESAGIPANELTEKGVDMLSDGIKDNLNTSAKTSSPNPMNWDFIKLDSEDLYKPAYITVDLYNSSATDPTPEGMLYCKVGTYMDISKNGYDPNITRLFTVFGSSYVYLYKPVIGMKIPALEPGQRMTVPIFLEENIGSSSTNGVTISSSDFNIMYGGIGAFDFDISIDYELPPLMDEAKKQGYTKNAIYSWGTVGTGISFTTMPGQSYGN